MPARFSHVASGFAYNIYSYGRTRPHRSSEAHWRDLSIRLSAQMRQVPADPAHRVSPLRRYHMMGRRRQGFEARASTVEPL